MSTATISDTAKHDEKSTRLPSFRLLDRSSVLLSSSPSFAIVRPKTFSHGGQYPDNASADGGGRHRRTWYDDDYYFRGIDLSIGSNVALCTVVIAPMLSKLACYRYLPRNRQEFYAALFRGLMIGLPITRLSLYPVHRNAWNVGAPGARPRDYQVKPWYRRLRRGSTAFSRAWVQEANG